MAVVGREPGRPLRRSASIRARAFAAARDFIDDEFGSYLVFLTILMPVLIGVGALGAEGAYLLTQHRQAQAAADWRR